MRSYKNEDINDILLYVTVTHRYFNKYMKV